MQDCIGRESELAGLRAALERSLAGHASRGRAGSPPTSPGQQLACSRRDPRPDRNALERVSPATQGVLGNAAVIGARFDAGLLQRVLPEQQIDPGKLTPDAALAAEAFITLITYQNNGYALLES